MIRVVLPYHLRNIAKVQGEIDFDLAEPVTIGAVLDALEARYPALRGTIRDHESRKRRPFVRFFACKLDLSNEPAGFILPPEIANGSEPFLVVGAMAGG
jgi:hypothetical protein